MEQALEGLETAARLFPSGPAAYYYLARGSLMQGRGPAAEAYLEEILLRDYLDPDTSSVCPAPEATRDLYDNVCDYALLDDAGARSQDGTPVAGARVSARPGPEAVLFPSPQYRHFDLWMAIP